MSRLRAIASRISQRTRSQKQSDPGAPHDHAFLDSAFDAILGEVEQGHEVDPETLCEGRPELLPAIEELIDLARAVSPTAASRALPESPAGYTIVSQIGRGGMATVYLARQHSVGDRPVALKMLSGAVAGGLTRERFRREALAIASLNHRHIVPVHDIMPIGDSFAFAMEYVDGGTLHDVIAAAAGRGTVAGAVGARRGIAPQSDVHSGPEYVRLIAGWGVQIADALHAVHAAGMLHRDVKPCNVLIDRDGTALLSDFGLVRDSSASSLTVSGAFAGTAAYSSPEQLRGTRSLDARSDVYSLGATLFHAMMLRRPFTGDSAVQVLLSIGDGGAPPMRGPNHIPADLALVVRKAMDPDPARRYATAADFAADLRRFIEHRPVLARTPSPVYRLRKFARRYRTQVAAAAVTGLAVAALAIAVIVRVAWWPQWSNEALMAARHIGASPHFHNLMFNYGYWDLPLDNRNSVVAKTSNPSFRIPLVETLRLYDRAISYGDHTPQTLAERDATDFLLAQCAGQPMLHRDVTITPMVSDYVRWIMSSVPTSEQLERAGAKGWALLDERTVPIYRQLSGASAREARQIGLMAYQLGDVGTALHAWREMERQNDPDPFSEGMLGLLLLIGDEPVIAYPRLYRAALAFPQNGVLWMYAADAAIRCHDLAKARQLLERAKSLPPRDIGFVRLDIMLQLESGDVNGAVAEARRRFATIDAGASVVLGIQFAHRLREMGQPEQLPLEFAALACWSPPIPPRAVRTLLPLAERFWEQASHQARRDMVAHSLTAEGRPPQGLAWPDGLLRGILAATPVPGQGVFASPPFIAFRKRYEAALPRIATSEFFAAMQRTSVARQDEIAQWLLTGEGETPVELTAR